VTEFVAIVPAAGTGSRAGGDIPKQYRHLAGGPVISHTLRALVADNRVRAVVLVLANPDQAPADLESGLGVPLVCCAGGQTRAESVRLGLASADRLGLARVLVHDAVRPCLHADDLAAVLDAAIDCRDGAILARPVAETVKRGEAFVTETVPREGLWLAQTPQVFDREQLDEALAAALEAGRSITDESSAMEAAGYQPRLVRARHPNPKITWPEDLDLAERLLAGLNGGRRP